MINENIQYDVKNNITSHLFLIKKYFIVMQFMCIFSQNMSNIDILFSEKK